jgi:hypothetical protein
MKTSLLKNKLAGLLIVGLIVTGCRMSNPIIVRVVNVTATKDVCGKSVEIHLVGVNKSQEKQWDTESMTKYWEPENQLRTSAKAYTRVIKFGQGLPCEIILDKKDPIRKIWKKRKAEYLYILADLPGIFDDEDGDADARRLQIPALNSNCWPFLENKIKINVESSGIVRLTPHKCE